MKSLAVRVLGDFGVDGVEPQALGSRKARLALRLLALADGHTVPSAVLADALWGDSPPARPDDQLAVLMSRLRSVLGRDRIEHHDGGYLLRCDWLDAAELAKLTDETDRRRGAGNTVGAAAAARVALSLISGAGPAPVPGEWAELRLAGLERLASRARRAAAAALLEAGDWVAAAEAAAEALDRDPYDEESLRVLLRSYVCGGRVAAALASYAKARERLAEELGTDPSPETAALFTAILRGELAPSTPVPVSVPAGLVGRDGELASLDAAAIRARTGPVEVAVVDGEAGIGKTTLLRAWAGRRAAAGDTVLLASCGRLDQAMPLDALLTALAALLRRLGPELSADLLGSDQVLLGPLLGAAPGPRPRLELTDGLLGPAVLYAALLRVLGRLAGRGPVVVVIDDAHLAGRALADWVRFAQRGEVPLALVLAVRPGEGEPLPATALIHLGVLDRQAAAELVGPARIEELYPRSRGHPLFLTELAQQAPGGELPASLVESVSAAASELGSAGTLLRTAAVIGPRLDVDLLAAVLGRPAVELLDDAERAAARRLLVAEGGTFAFRHELVREALAASATAGRAALLHRQAGRVLARRADTDPLTVAHHARLGGDVVLAAQALRDAAARAAERFDHAAAEELLDDSLRLHEEPDGWLARARVRTQRGRYAAALSDVERAAAAGPAALELGAWASYFDRRFAQAAQFADDGALAAADPATRARCLAAGGRTRHAAGDLAQAELLLGEAFSLATGQERVTAAAWLGVLRAHQSRPDEALELLRPAARGQVGVEHTSATLHSLLFTGHAHALAGRRSRRWPLSPATPPRCGAAMCPGSPAAPSTSRAGCSATSGPPKRRSTTTTRRLTPRRGRAPRRSPSPPSKTWPSTAWVRVTLMGRRPGSRRPARCCTATWSSAGGWTSSTGSSPAAWPCAGASRNRPSAPRATWRTGLPSSASRATPAPPGCCGTGPAGRWACRPIPVRSPPTSTASKPPWPSRRGGGPVRWPPTSPAPPGWTWPPGGPNGWPATRAATRK